MQFLFDRVENNVGKGENAGFSPSMIIFKSHHRGKGLIDFTDSVVIFGDLKEFEVVVQGFTSQENLVPCTQ